MASSSTKKSSSSKRQVHHVVSSLAEERRLLRSERSSRKKSAVNHVSQKQLARFNTLIHQMTPEQLNEELAEQQLSMRGDVQVRSTRLKHHCKAEAMFGCENPLAMIAQDFDYIAVVDFEATCDGLPGNTYPHEIIEFPIVLIDVQQQTIVEQFQSYCRPTHNPNLTKFCTDLTGIQQCQVDKAPTFVEVLHNVERWLNDRNLLTSLSERRLAFATDGPWDFDKFLQLQCRHSSIPYPQWAHRWINIRKAFARFYSMPSCGIVKMLGRLGLSFDGRRHSGLDDAINIAHIGIQLLKDGCVLSLNDSLQTVDSKLRTTSEQSSEAVGGAATAADDDEVVFED